MTKKELEKKLNELNIDKFAYNLNGGLPNEKNLRVSGTLTIQSEVNALH